MSHVMPSHSIKNEIKENFSLSLPLVSSQLVYACSNFIATALVAKLGEQALAASILVSMTWFSISVLFFGMLNSVSVLVSHQYGAKNDLAISEIMGQSFILGVLIILLSSSMLFITPLLLRLTHQPPEVLQLSMNYLHALVWTLPGLIVLITCEQFLAGINRVKLVLRISMLVVPIEILLIYFLIFGKFGLPACGIAGIGYGFATTYTLTAICLTTYLVRSAAFKRFDIFNGIARINLHWLKELIRIGLPMGCMNLIEVSSFAVATYWIARFGTTILAAHQIVMQYLGFAITVVFAMSQAVSVRVGHAVGRNDLTGVRYASYVGMLMNFAIVLVIVFAFYFIPHFFLRLDMDIHDSKNATLMYEASLLLGLGGLLMLCDNFRIIIGYGALRGLKDTKFAMYVSFLSFWLIGLSSAYYLAFVRKLAETGVWVGLIFGITCGALIMFGRLYYLLKHIDLKKIMHVDTVGS